ncbi:MAG TPA: ATP-grasp domain-containing protein [Gemmatimonadaceae bacterium]|nr:ATP-grasp domain-containing protein [Gemmatimonadaceae bacterium]
MRDATAVLLVGVSTRAIAESAVCAGYTVTAVDGFGDRDQLRLGRVVSLPRDVGVAYSAHHAARAACTIDCNAVAYVSNFENHPRLVARLAEGRQLLGNSPAVLERVRDPVGVARALRERGVAVPGVRDAGSGMRDAGTASGERASSPRAVAHPASRIPHPAPWLLKPRASGGGHGITRWRAGEPVAAHAVLQEYIDGVPGSIVFAADGARAGPFALTRQLIGDAAFGASGFMYCGNILSAAQDAPWADDARVAEQSCAMAQAAVEEFGLVGVNGIDFVARNGVPYLVEINPRYTAAMELAERAYDVPVFRLHVSGCTGAAPMAFDLASARRARGAVGKAIVYARRTVVIGDTHRWLEDDDMRDVPHAGERIARGRPVCTIFARGPTAESCYAALVRRAERVYEELDGWRRRSA